MSAALSMSDPSPGELANNGIMIMCLTRAVRSGESAFATAPPLITETLEKGAWRHWTDAGGPHAYAADRFQEFVEAQPPRGLGVTLAVVESLLKPDSRAWVLFHEAIRHQVGRPQTIRDNITDFSGPDIVPFPASQGTSASYAIRRLGSVPELLERVKAGELSSHAAMVAAGFRERSITIPDDPEKAARRLLRHFQGDRLAILIDHLTR